MGKSTLCLYKHDTKYAPGCGYNQVVNLNVDMTEWYEFYSQRHIKNQCNIF